MQNNAFSIQSLKTTFFIDLLNNFYCNNSIVANCVFCLQMWRITLIKSEVKLLLQRYTYWDIWNEIILRKNVCKRIFLCTCSRNIFVIQIVHVSLEQVKYLEMMIFLKELCRFLGSWKCFWIFYFLWSGFYYHI